LFGIGKEEEVPSPEEARVKLAKKAPNRKEPFLEKSLNHREC